MDHLQSIMKFKEPVVDLFHHMFAVRQSEGGMFNVGVYPVMFGFRVRVWITGRPCCILDWCGGAHQRRVEELYSMAIDILQQRDEVPNCLDGVPAVSFKKPFFNDDEFVATVGGMLSSDFQLITLPDLYVARDSILGRDRWEWKLEEAMDLPGTTGMRMEEQTN